MGLHNKVKREIENFIELFLPVVDTDPNFEIFNDEPQNDKL